MSKQPSRIFFRVALRIYSIIPSIHLPHELKGLILVGVALHQNLKYFLFQPEQPEHA